MKEITILALLLLISSCGKCPQCLNISDPIRIIYLDENGTNLLANESLKVNRVYLQNSNEDIYFAVKDFVVNGSIEKYHIELADEQLHEKCLDNQCAIIFNFENNTINDTLIYSINELKADCCTSYYVDEFLYNNHSYLNNKENTIGAYSVIK